MQALHLMKSADPIVTVPAVVTGTSPLVLTYSSDGEPGIQRRGMNGKFWYVDSDGKRVSDEDSLKRIAALAIPPAYREVWICSDPNGHLQATGRDAKSRKQYRYHPAWRTLRDRDKFTRVANFGRLLPRLRRRVRSDLKLKGLCQQKVLALAISVLEATLIRVGNRQYLRSNGSYGLTTLRTRHAYFPRAGVARLRFRGKSGRSHELDVNDGKLVRLLRRCQRLPGQPLFQYLDEDGANHGIDSGMLNGYLNEAMGESFTAKDFRTWGATRLAAEILAASPPAGENERLLATQLNQAVAEVAAALGNTAAVCRSSYIHPAVIEAWRRNELRAIAERKRSQRWVENRVISLLEKDRRRTLRVKKT